MRREIHLLWQEIAASAEEMAEMPQEIVLPPEGNAVLRLEINPRRLETDGLPLEMSGMAREMSEMRRENDPPAQEKERLFWICAIPLSLKRRTSVPATHQPLSH